MQIKNDTNINIISLRITEYI